MELSTALKYAVRKSFFVSFLGLSYCTEFIFHCGMGQGSDIRFDVLFFYLFPFPISQPGTAQQNPGLKGLTGLRGVIYSSGHSLCKVISAQVLSYLLPQQAHLLLALQTRSLWRGVGIMGEKHLPAGLGHRVLGSRMAVFPTPCPSFPLPFPTKGSHFLLHGPGMLPSTSMLPTWAHIWFCRAVHGGPKPTLTHLLNAQSMPSFP